MPTSTDVLNAEGWTIINEGAGEQLVQIRSGGRVVLQLSTELPEAESNVGMILAEDKLSEIKVTRIPEGHSLYAKALDATRAVIACLYRGPVEDDAGSDPGNGGTDPGNGGTGPETGGDPANFNFAVVSTLGSYRWTAMGYGNGLVLIESGLNDQRNLGYTSDGVNIQYTALSALGHANVARDITYAPALGLYLRSGQSQVWRMTPGLAAYNGVAVGANGNAYTSITWAEELGLALMTQSYPATSVIWTSPDGSSFTARSLGVGVAWNDVAWGKELGVAVAVGDGYISWSADGINWNPVSVGAGLLTSITYSPEYQMFVTLGSDRALWSLDGKVWTAVGLPVALGFNGRIAWCDAWRTFVAVGNSAAVKSGDGKTWVATSIPSGNWTSLCWHPVAQRLLAGNYSTGQILSAASV